MKGLRAAMPLRTFAIVAAWLSIGHAMSLAAAPGETGSTQLTEVLAKAVGLMEQGTEKLLAETRAREVTTGDAVSDKASRNATVGAMEQILKDFRSLHLIAGKLKTRVSSDMESLKAQVAAQKQMLETSDARVKNLQEANDILRASVKDEMSKSELCAVSLQKAAEQQTSAMAEDLQASKSAVAKLTGEVSQLHEQLNGTRELCQVTTAELQQEKKAIQDELEKSEAQKKDMEADKQAIQDKASAELQQEIGLNHSMQEQVEQLAAAKEKQMDFEEEETEDAASLKELKENNLKLKQQSSERLQEVASLQQHMDQVNADRARLLDSIRMFMHENNQLKLHAVGGAKVDSAFTKEATAGLAAPEAPPGMRIQDESDANADIVSQNIITMVGRKDDSESHGLSGNQKKDEDAIGWMAKTTSIDAYLGRLSTDEKTAAEQKTAVEAARIATATTPAPQSVPLGDYLGMAPPPAAAVEKVAKVIKEHEFDGPAARVVDKHNAVVDQLAALDAPAVKATSVESKPRTGKALDGFLKPSKNPEPATVEAVEQSKQETHELEDIKDAENLYSEAENLISSASAAL
jgi:hypothetical protein